MPGNLIAALISSLRPKQWTKNLLVFAGYLFTVEQGHDPALLLKVFAAFVAFCAVSGAGYIFNDAADAECDRQHPGKCKRPIASGAISTASAIVFAIALVLGSLWGSFALGYPFGLLVLAYFVLTILYSASLKHVVIVDLLAIAAGFVIRAVAGAVVIGVAISPWLLVCTTLLALFLGLAKRRSELNGLEEAAFGHRKTLGEYTSPMLDQMLNISASAALMAYFLYTFAPGSKTAANHPYMMITVPFVIYGLFRYLYLVHTRNAGDSPERILIEDRPMLLNTVLYVIAVMVALKLPAP